MNVFEVADYEDRTEAEKARQAKSAAEAGYKSVDDIKPNIFQRAAGELARENKTPDKPKELPSELNMMRRRLGMQETGTDPDDERGFLSKAYDFMGKRTGIGATAGGILGTALAPETGGLSILLPALMAGAGGATGAITEGKSPIKEGLFEGATQGIFGGGAKALKPLKQFAERTAIKTFGGRAGVSEAAEGLFKRWFTPKQAASALYEKAAQTGAVVPLAETATTVNGMLKGETGRLPLEIQSELKAHLEPIQKFITPTAGKNKYLVAQNVEDSIADVHRLSEASRKAFKDGKTDLGRAINSVRASMLDDLDKVGVPEVREASKNWRRRMAIEELSEQIARPFPGIKLRDAYRKNPLFDKSFTAPEKEQIDRIVKKLEYVTPSAMSGAFGKAISGAAGALAGAPLGPIASGALGWGGVVGAEYLRELLQSPVGRNFMERVLDDSYKMGTGKVVQTVGPVLAIFARGLMSSSPEVQ